MTVFYYCQTGKYAALLAGALHLDKLEKNFTYKEFIDYVESINLTSYNPYFLGEDCHGTKVYVISTERKGRLVSTIVNSFLATFTKESQNTLVVNSLPKANFFLLCILKLSTVFFLKFIGKKIIPYAVWTNRNNICNASNSLSLT